MFAILDRPELRFSGLYAKYATLLHRRRRRQRRR